MHRMPYLLGHLQECVDQPRRRRIRLVQQRRDQAWYWLSQGVGKPEALERWLETHVGRQTAAADRREMARAGQDFRQPAPAGDRRILRAHTLRLCQYAAIGRAR